MLVTITEATPHPLETISRAAGMSTDKSNKSFKRAETCIRQDHAVSEFADATFRIEGISRACYDKETEILTYNGWKYIKDVKVGEQVLTFNPHTKHSEFQPVEEVINYRYDGDMHHYHSQSIDLLVTPNHKMWMKKYDVRTPDSFHLESSENISVKRFYFDKRMKYHHKVSSDFILPSVSYYRYNKNGEKFLKTLSEKRFQRDDVMRFLAWYISEGFSCYSEKDNTWRIAISQLKQQNYERIEQSLTSCDLTASIYYHKTEAGRIPIGFRCGSLQWGYFLDKCGHTANEKRLPFENLFQEFDAHTAKVFIDEYLYGDGSIDANGCGKLYTSSPILADQLYTLCYMAGYTATKTTRKRESDIYYKSGILGEIKQNYPSYILNVSLNGKRNYRPMIQKKNNFDTVDYHDNVYCVTVPNHIIFVRRSGKAAWCGNCVSQLTRHRIASFCVESQRYVRYDLSGDDWYVVPMGVDDIPELVEVYRADMHLAASTYRELIDNGVPPEDARFVLPGSMKTNLEMKMNIRSLFHFFDLRLDSHAQWEIQFLASKMMDALAAYSDQWARVIEIYTETRK